MVLSFFSKKTPPSPASSPRAREIARPAAVKPSPRVSPAPPRQTEPSPRTELSTLDFSRAGVDGLDVVEVQEVGAGIGAVFEEAAVLYANGDIAEAEKILSAAIDDDTSVSGEGLWMMLLDLYRLTGQQQRFESRVLDYAVRFERSPPSWEDLSSQPARKQVATVPLINLAGMLSIESKKQLVQMLEVACKTGSVRVDLGRIQGGDEAGCTLLRQALLRLEKERVKVSLLNCKSAADVLSPCVEAGKAERRETWLLILHILQGTGDQDRFEQMALDYAITFEESPPSWQDHSPPVEEANAGSVDDLVKMDDSFVLEGELVGNTQETLRKMSSFAAERDNLIIECALLRRVDFVNAGSLFNVLSGLLSQHKRVEIQNVNAMVAALLRVMGVDQVATVTLRP